MAEAARCYLLELPIELRSAILDYASPSYRTVTVGIAGLEGKRADLVYRQYGRGRSPFPGIPVYSEAVVERKYDASLLSTTDAKTLHLTSTTPDPTEDTQLETGYKSVILVNKQVNNELKRHFALKTRRQTDLFIQYPHGLHVLQSGAPQLLRRSRTVHIAGTYKPHEFSVQRAARLPGHTAEPGWKSQGDVIVDTAKELEQLVRTMFKSKSSPPSFEKLEMRIYFPGDNSLGVPWCDDDSPIAVALRNVGPVRIELESWRGNEGNAVFLTAYPNGTGRRCVTQSYHRLREGSRGQPEPGSCVINPDWPGSSKLDESATPAPRIAGS
ncbi:unnamed protein product [Zymoseptoria tritici ST99CH_1A5]|uniref:Uncharacterized protein n=1 Tax=Zymoseptoria tritici ST99CH_1A5 TaxID=1276529 RepID=A0A1Y6LD05_ZYMTR|nr:unnamed protein product [Zymoseptoria tritici ST99CH_1A5]